CQGRPLNEKLARRLQEWTDIEAPALPVNGIMKTLERILIVDDEPLVLAAYERALRHKFALEKAADGNAGLQTIAEKGPFAVVVSDLRMPGMDGIRFLAQVRQVAPDSVRAMLTGYAELQTAIDAVNEGSVFRFLTKPCPADALALVLTACVEQYRLVTAEKELLERTLSGSVRVLTDMLSLVNPLAFSRSQRIREYVVHLTTKLQLAEPWRYELAALLSQLGCVTLPAEMLEAIYSGKQLSPEENKKFTNHPLISANLLKNIPRLETVAEMIAAQASSGHENRGLGESTHDVVQTGACILRLAGELDDLVRDGMPVRAALSELRNRVRGYDPTWLAALEDLNVETETPTTRAIHISVLTPGMALAEDIRTDSGLLLVTEGQAISYALLERLRNFAHRGAIREQVLIKIPRPAAHESSEPTSHDAQRATETSVAK
ncbi:MAG: HD domain-containing phosphohydrolase, partial [Candidatus Acidiferrales bacterium]